MRQFIWAYVFLAISWTGCGEDSSRSTADKASTTGAQAPLSVPMPVFNEVEESALDGANLLESSQVQLDGRLQNSWSKKCLAVTNSKSKVVTHIPCDGEPSQYVRQNSIGPNLVRLEVGAFNLCLQVKGKDQGTKLQVKKCGKSKAQQFEVKQFSPSRAQFMSIFNELCLILPYDGILQQSYCSTPGSADSFGPVEIPPEKPSPEKWVRETHTVVKDGYQTIIIPKLNPSPNAQLILGLLVLVDFADNPFTQTNVFDAAVKMNHDLRGYSIYQKNIDLQHVVIGNIRSSKPYSYFIDPNHPEKANEYIRSKELIRELYAKMNGITQFDFSTLTLHNTWTPNYVVNSFIMLYAADDNSGRGGWARGLWPVSAWESGTVQKTEFAHYQESAINQTRKDFGMGTIIHETGHQVMGLGEDQGDWGNANWHEWCSQNCFP